MITAAKIFPASTSTEIEFCKKSQDLKLDFKFRYNLISGTGNLVDLRQGYFGNVSLIHNKPNTGIRENMLKDQFYTTRKFDQKIKTNSEYETRLYTKNSAKLT